MRGKQLTDICLRKFCPPEDAALKELEIEQKRYHSVDETAISLPSKVQDLSVAKYNAARSYAKQKADYALSPKLS